MKAVDVMTRGVLSVRPDDSIGDAVRLMLDHKVSGLPVVDPAGRLVGILTEGDLLRRAETDTQRHRPRWIEFLIGPGRLANEYVHASGRKVHEVMTRDIHTVTPETPLSEVVDLMVKHRIKRVPVMDGGAVVGIVARANLLPAMATLAHDAQPSNGADREIREALLAELKRQPWAPITQLDFEVRNGVVQLRGAITDERQREAVQVAAENIPGVREVVDHLVWVEPTSGMYFLSEIDRAAAEKH